ncbi:hypothetical protein ACF064_01505 [Streptomyces sp. NPDC015492]|uniref:hypothetical protein n=1 Tax=Streptomyces sp. NPDC015492 TaxID=3364958 RepID=UPI0036F6EEC7
MAAACLAIGFLVGTWKDSNADAGTGTAEFLSCSTGEYAAGGGPYAQGRYTVTNPTDAARTYTVRVSLYGLMRTEEVGVSAGQTVTLERRYGGQFTGTECTATITATK